MAGEAVTDPEFQFYDIHATMLVERGGRVYEEGITPPVCDFCMDTRVRWEYPCATFVHGSFGSDDSWLTCDRCSALVEADERVMLCERSLESWRLRGMIVVPAMRTELLAMQAGFFELRRGPRVAFG